MIERQENPIGRQDAVQSSSDNLRTLNDVQLLGRFSDARDDRRELAFRELIDRHGPMVMGVCRHALRHPHDAEDAFQATFLVLVVKARSIRVSGSLAPWLHGVAVKTAHRARAASARYRGNAETNLDAIVSTSGETQHAELGWMLHEELGRLPEKYRAPIVLCHLAGKTHEEAARILQWPVGTVSGRLSRGRRLLKSRLERHGFAELSASVLLASPLSAHSLPTSAINSALNTAMQFPILKASSVPVLSLTRGVLKVMFLNRLKVISAAVVLMGVASAAVWAHMPSRDLRQTPQVSLAAATSPTDEPAAASEITQTSHDSLATQPSTDCPLANAAEGPPYCPLAMAANAMSRAVGYFHGTGSTPSK
jgi:RNA polymerase sigma factor (sigma-70 family)